MARPYEATHPWLRFEADLRDATPALWMLLGEARSKCEHIRGVPLRPDTAERLHILYLAKGVQATTAIEGNTLTESEVKARIEGTLNLPPSKEYLGHEVDNVVVACRDIFARLQADSAARVITPEMIGRYNAQVLANLNLDDAVEPGELRQHSVVVGNYRGAPAGDCGYLLERLCEWLNGEQFRSPDYGVAIDILRAVLAHLYLAWIHPFGDGNGRTARLVEFHILLAAGVSAPAAHLLSNHYNQTRSEYYRQLDRASRSGGDVVPFVHYAVQGFVDQLQQQLAYIRQQQWDVAWRNYVHERYVDAGPTGVRQRHLVLDLSATHDGQWVPIRTLPDLTPRLAKAYASKTPRTLFRDVEALAKLKLVDMEAGRVRARPDIILAFLPAAVRSEPAERAPATKAKPTPP